MHFLPLLYVVCGAANVLLIKWSDTLQGECSDGKWRSFQHPVMQTALMFLGECLCFCIYKIVYYFLERRGDGSENMNLITRGGREFSPLSLLLPALLDTIASLLLFTGLYLTYASSFQMIRGASLIMVGIFSSIILNQTLVSRHWMAMFTIVCGLTVIVSIDVQRVYYDYASLPNRDSNAVLTGNLMVICAQIFHAAQFVYEEKHLKGTDVPPMQAVGWQGIFGFIITAFLGLCMNFLPTQLPFNNNSHGVFDDVGDFFSQMRSNGLIPFALILFMFTSACYNFTALSIVKFSSTANRILADGLRVIFIWLVALIMEWEVLNLITIMGFFILQMGAVAYRNAIFIEWYRSLLARIMQRRYMDMSTERGGNDGVVSGSAVPTNHPADVI